MTVDVAPRANRPIFADVTPLFYPCPTCGRQTRFTLVRIKTFFDGSEAEVYRCEVCGWQKIYVTR